MNSLKTSTIKSRRFPKNLIQPRNSVVGPAVERLKYCLDEKEIRDMFLNLLSASVDSRKAGQVHPSFADIVSQMSFARISGTRPSVSW